VKYERVLLKLSGEQFAGNNSFGIDSDFINNLAKAIKVVADMGVQVVVIVGGGNFARGRDLKVKGLHPTTGHYMGMTATVINSLALTDVLESVGQPAHLQSSLAVEKAAEAFAERSALKHLKNGEVLVIAGGTGSPYVTTDTGAVSYALRLGCEVVLKATKVDGVYDKDPTKHKDAKKYNSLSHVQALQNPDINVMDNAATALAMDHRLPIIVFKLSKENLKKVVQGQSVGTEVSWTKLAEDLPEEAV